jgi:tripartite-type tricarboxylate transporter receptor subunit TctC
MAGHANVLITNLGVLTNHIKTGKLKALAITSDKRALDLPEVPTLAEAGVRGLEVYSWQGISAPKGVPAPVREKLVSALAATLKDPQVRKTLETAGYDVVALPPAQASAELSSEITRWKAVIDTAGIKAD